MPAIDGPLRGLWVQTTGEGAPVTVFAHGLTSSSADIATLGDPVPGKRIFFDFRGHGRSAAPDGPRYDLVAMTADLDAVARTHGATNLVGVSMGAAAALRLMAAAPGRFDRTVLVMPAWLEGAAPEARAAHRALLADLERRSLDDIADTILASAEVRALVRRAPAWEERLRTLAMRMQPEGVRPALRAAAEAGPALDDLNALRAVRTDVLVLAHEGDVEHPASDARRLGSLLPKAEIRVWDEPLAMLDDTDACGRLIAAFLTRERVDA